MEVLTYIGKPMHGKTHIIGENTVGALDTGHWYKRKTLHFALDDGGAASCDFLVHSGLSDADAVKLARPFVLAFIAEQKGE